MPTCIVDNQGRIVIPSSWRRQQRIGSGSELVALEEDGRLILETREQSIREAQQIVRSSMGRGRSLVHDLLRERRAEVAREKKRARRRIPGDD
jgi:AbrB family looped-hinge helix DNA binding protein